MCGNDKRITGTPATGRVFGQNAVCHEFKNVAQCGVLGALRHLGPFRRCQFTFDPVKQLIQDQTLAVIKRCSSVRFPEAGPLEHDCKCALHAVKCVVQAIEKPFQPCRNVKRSFLCLLQTTIIGVPFVPYLCRHAVEALRTLLRPGEHHVGESTGRYVHCRLRKDGW